MHPIQAIQPFNHAIACSIDPIDYPAIQYKCINIFRLLQHFNKCKTSSLFIALVGLACVPRCWQTEFIVLASMNCRWVVARARGGTTEKVALCHDFMVPQVLHGISRSPPDRIAATPDVRQPMQQQLKERHTPIHTAGCRRHTIWGIE